MKKIVIGITGASGSIYGIKVIRELVNHGIQVHVIATDNGKKVVEFETGENLDNHFSDLLKAGSIVMHEVDNLFAPVASGSFRFDGMAVVPCSMTSLSGIASGSLNNLLGRACSVTLKEGRKLVVVPRESPYSRINLEAMLKLHDAGGIILPASPGFYFKPASIGEIVDFIAGRILSALDIENNLTDEWS